MSPTLTELANLLAIRKMVTERQLGDSKFLGRSVGEVFLLSRPTK